MFTGRVAIQSKKKATDFGLAQVLQNDTWSGSVSFCPIQPSGREPRAPSHPMIMSPQSIAPYSRGLPVGRCSRGETSFKRTTRAVETSPLRFLLGSAMMVAGAIGTRVEGRAATIFDVPTNELPDPAIIASATPFSSTYTAANDHRYAQSFVTSATTETLTEVSLDLSASAITSFDVGLWLHFNNQPLSRLEYLSRPRDVTLTSPYVISGLTEVVAPSTQYWIVVHRIAGADISWGYTDDQGVANGYRVGRRGAMEHHVRYRPSKRCVCGS